MSLITRHDVRGIFPPVVTPFTTDEEIDTPQFEAELDLLLELPVTGLVVGGSTGEGYALTADELATLTALAVQHAARLADPVPVVTGIITTSTREAVHRAQLARHAGATGVMVTPPIYQRPSLDNLIEYYSRIHAGSGLPIIIYNVLPSTPLPPAVIRRLAAVPGVVATKESAGSTLTWLSELIDTAADQLSITWATDHTLFPGFALGATGAISGTTSLFPRESLAMFDAVQRNDYDEARRIHYALEPVTRQIMSGENWPGALKAAFNLLGRNVGPARSPFTRPTGESYAALEDGIRIAKTALS